MKISKCSEASREVNWNLLNLLWSLWENDVIVVDLLEKEKKTAFNFLIYCLTKIFN